MLRGINLKRKNELSKQENDPLGKRVLSEGISAATMMNETDSIGFVNCPRSTLYPFLPWQDLRAWPSGGSGGRRTVESFATTAILLGALGVRLVLVHGARPQIEEELARRKLPFASAQRNTDHRCRSA